MISGMDISWTDSNGKVHNEKLTIGPVPERFAAVYLRRGLDVPHAASTPSRGAAWPYRHRGRHRRWARLHGFFWLPCVLCGREFGGHEIVDVIPDPMNGPGRGISICPVCTAERNGGKP